MISKKKLVIFDLDGTLIDAYRAIEDSLNFTLNRLRYPLESKNMIRRAVGRGDIYLLKLFVNQRDLSRAICIYRKRHAWSLKRYSRLMPGALDVIKILKNRNVLLGVASNRPTLFARIALKALHVEKFFDQILCADKIKFRKPHPLILNELMRYFHVFKEDVIYCGDMVLDVETGKRAHITTIAIATGSNTYAELKKAKPTFLFKNLKALRSFVVKGKL